MSKAPTRLPLFPLGGAILFPRSHLPLHVFEPRYRQMVEDAVAGDGKIGMIQPRAEPDDGLGQPELYRVGCIGEIVGLEELGDGRYNVVLQGTTRFRLIAEADVGTPYRQADVVPSGEDEAEPDALASILRAAVEQEARLLGDAMGLTVDWHAVERLDDEMLVNAISQVAPFDPGAKQALLECAVLAERAQLLIQLMQFLRAAHGGGDLSPRLQ
ncbi:LON peptidase substrate-binding domain-containing protein [Sphingomonas swuensis]|uniref:LON peptidase substrate-binding domain-containing protein n=1 Tax=Sphingomonas swuensis TaxID=977800 RepID=A0ABP7SBZ1_9SPHN